MYNDRIEIITIRNSALSACRHLREYFKGVPPQQDLWCLSSCKFAIMIAQTQQLSKCVSKAHRVTLPLTVCNFLLDVILNYAIEKAILDVPLYKCSKLQINAAVHLIL